MTEHPDHPSHTLASRKEALRRNALARRDQFAANPVNAVAAAKAVADRIIALRDIAGHPLSMLLGKNVTVAGYWPIRSELDPRPLMTGLASHGTTLALPVVSPSGLIFRRWQQETKLSAAGFGTLGPDHTQPIVDPDVLLVPMAAFDRTGHRLGYGKGHYDGAIARLSARKNRFLTVGLAFDVQEIDHVPAEPHDQPLDVIITPVQSMIFK